MKDVNSWAVLLLRYSKDFVHWTKTELSKPDRSTMKEFNMNGEHHPRTGIARLYLPRKESRRRLISEEDWVELTRVDINSCVGNSEKGFVKSC